MRVAVIPARGGSKRIPRKNIKLFGGRPMIAWSIEAAMESGCFDRLVVSTDDNEIAEVARRHGAETPFVRPSELSDDLTGTAAVIRHAIKWFTETGLTPAYVCCIYATAPFVTPADIRRGLDVLIRGGSEYAFSVTSYPFPIQRAIRINTQDRVEMFNPEHLNTRSQDLEEAFHDAGQFYWGRTNAWLTGKNIFGPDAVAVRLPRHRVQDIDNYEDWQVAEQLFNLLKFWGSVSDRQP